MIGHESRVHASDNNGNARMNTLRKRDNFNNTGIPVSHASGDEHYIGTYAPKLALDCIAHDSVPGIIPLHIRQNFRFRDYLSECLTCSVRIPFRSSESFSRKPIFVIQTIDDPHNVSGTFEHPGYDEQAVWFHEKIVECKIVYRRKYQKRK
jgi:hypothetical protein